MHSQIRDKITKKKGRIKSGKSGCCPDCGEFSFSVHKYGFRKLNHYALGKMEVKLFDTISFRCINRGCLRTSFTILLSGDETEEVVGLSRYTQSSKNFVANKMLKHQVSYNSFQQQIREDFGGKTSLSSLHKWTSDAKVESAVGNLSDMKVLHTDEKHPSKKKEKVTKNTS